MKVLKIILAIAVLAVLGYFGWNGRESLFSTNTDSIEIDTKNPYITRIEKEIDSLSLMPNHTFSQEFYKAIQYRINDYQNQSLFGENEKDNHQWHDILSKNLYTTYAPKFIDEAMEVFNSTEWPYQDLRFIRAEKDTLQTSEYLQVGSPVSNSFNNIGIILSKYYEVNRFISSCQRIGFSNYNLQDQFPNLEDKINRTNRYLGNNLENSYVNNCIRLKKELRKIPRLLFNKHVSYMQNKIEHHSNQFQRYESQRRYHEELYEPLKKQLEILEVNTYNISSRDHYNAYRDLEISLNLDNREAYKYFQSINDN